MPLLSAFPKTGTFVFAEGFELSVVCAGFLDDFM
jgi:hypothetical protein